MAKNNETLLPADFNESVAAKDTGKVNAAALNAMSRLLDEWIQEPEHGSDFENKLRVLEQKAARAGRSLPATKDVELAMIVGGLKMAVAIFRELYRADQQDDEVYLSVMESDEPEAMIEVLEALRDKGNNGLSVGELCKEMDCEKQEMLQAAKTLAQSGAIVLAAPETRPTYQISKAGIRFLDAKDIWESLLDQDDDGAEEID